MYRKILLSPIEGWKSLSVSKKLYGVVGVMAVLIAAELFSLVFAMNVLSAVRAFVGGEGLWSKAQKNAIFELQKYISSHDEKDYLAFRESLAVNLGDRQARLEMTKQDMDESIVTRGFLAGRNHEKDIPSMIWLMRRFYRVSYIAEAIRVWGEADSTIDELSNLGERIHESIYLEREPRNSARLRGYVQELSRLNVRSTVLEDRFSFTLGEASRWLEGQLILILIFAVFTVEGTGLFLTVAFTRSLNRVLSELNDAAREVGSGNFSKEVPVRSTDELGQLAGAINKMTLNLRTITGEREQATEASEIKSLFLANMSHEIRTPLAAILGFVELLRDPKLPEAERLRYLGIVQRTGEGLSTIINDILDISAVEAGKLEVRRADCSLLEMLRDLRLLLQARCAGKGVELRFEPRGVIPNRIYTDPARLRQVLLNVIGNAIKFTSRGEVHVVYGQRGDFLEFSVRDTGIGISPEEIAKLFQPFSQLDLSIRKVHGGTGLGLVLSKRLARLLGGDVSLVGTEKGKGSTFCVRVSLERPLDLRPPERALAELPAPVSLPLQGRKVLLVEDNPDNQLLIERMLAKNGAAVEIAPNGLEGMQRALAGKFDVVLMDMQMPVMDGYAATEALRQRQYSAPIIALTAHAMKADVEKSRASGCDAVLTKPLQADALIRLIYKYCA